MTNLSDRFGSEFWSEIDAEVGAGIGVEARWGRDAGYKSFELPGARPHYTPDRPGQVEHIALDLVLDLPQERATGTCTIRLNPVRDGITSLRLDAVGMTIGGVSMGNASMGNASMGNKAQEFTYDGQELLVTLNQPLKAGKIVELAIDYTLDHPQRGIYFIKPTPDYPQKSLQVWTQGEDEDSRYWFPCFDYPGQLATSEIRVKVPKPLRVVSNGVLVKTVEEADGTVFHWQQQEVHPTYLMTLAVGDFAEISATVKVNKKTIPCPFYVPKGREAEGDRALGKTPQMIAFFSQIFGYPYPFPKYAQVVVEDFIFGGMENTSATLLTERVLLDERALLDNLRAETLVAHELAHQWFGDLVVIKHWSHAWIKEGMATYSEVLWTQEEYGPEAAAYAHFNAARDYLEEDASRYRRPIVTHVYREAIELYDRHLYEKASCVYHMLRSELGEVLFWQAIHRFVNDNAHRTVETIDVLRAIETATGRNFLSLFDQYVFRGGHPDYKVSYSWDAEAKLAKVTVSQLQVDAEGKGAFDLQLPIGFWTTVATDKVTDRAVAMERKTDRKRVGRNGEGGDDKRPEVKRSEVKRPEVKVVMVRVFEREQAFYFPLETKPEFISFDYKNAYLKTVELDYPLPELKAQLQWDPDPVSRIYAAEAIAKKGNLEALKALAVALTTDGFWGVRLEVARVLGMMKLDQAFAVLLPGLQDESAHVRRAVVQAIAGFMTLEAYKTLKAIAEKGDAAYGVEAAAIAALGKFTLVALNGESKEKPVLKLLKAILKERQGWNEVVRSAAIGALAQMKTSSGALALILEYTVLGVPQPLRLAAIRALGTISTGQDEAGVEQIISRLTEVSRESFFLTRLATIGALGQLKSPRALGLLRQQASCDDGRVKRLAEEAIAKVQEGLGAVKGMEQLRQDVEALQRENQGLRSRLEALEARRSEGEVGSRE